MMSSVALLLLVHLSLCFTWLFSVVFSITCAVMLLLVVVFDLTSAPGDIQCCCHSAPLFVSSILRLVVGLVRSSALLWTAGLPLLHVSAGGHVLCLFQTDHQLCITAEDFTVTLWTVRLELFSMAEQTQTVLCPTVTVQAVDLMWCFQVRNRH